MNTLVHTSFVGNTGYANHARSFLTELNKLTELKVRNYTVGDTWDGYNMTPHDKEPYMTDDMKKMLFQQILDDGKVRTDHPIYSYDKDFVADKHIVMIETNHHLFYDNYEGYKIGYNVWESTLYPDAFFRRLHEYNELWVPSEWQKNCVIKQGYPADRIRIVPEGVDANTFMPTNEKTTNNKFQFVVAGRWDYRKATKDIIQSWLNVFKNIEGVELLLLVDNPFPADGMKTTEERLEKYGLQSDKITVKHFVSREEYVTIVQNADVFISCARSEGWNLPLIEAMACGVPSLYSDWGGQLEFAQGKGLPVDILGEMPAHTDKKEDFSPNVPGNYCEPDFLHLEEVLLDTYNNIEQRKLQAVLESKEIREKFSWENAAKIAFDFLNDPIPGEPQKAAPGPLSMSYNYANGAFFEVTGGDPDKKYTVSFVNQNTNQVDYKITLTSGRTAMTNAKYYVPWRIIVEDEEDEVIFETKTEFKDERVFVTFDSKSLGDTLAWFPYVDEFRKKHGCKMICSTFWNSLFKEVYPDIEYVEPGSIVDNIHAMYRIGWFYEDEKEGELDMNRPIDLNKNPIDPRKQSLQKTAADILGIEYKEIRPLIKLSGTKKKKKQISIAIHSTCQAKYWNNPVGWQNVVDFCNKMGYKVILLSREPNGYMHNTHPTGIYQLPDGPIEKAIKTIEESEIFIGVDSGLGWLALCTATPSIIISGSFDGHTELAAARISAPEGVCSNCFNSYKLTFGDWAWCPEHKGTERHFECSKKITHNAVTDAIKKILSPDSGL